MNHPAHEWEQQREQLSALLDNELPAQERATLEAHLEGCDWCHDELESLRRTRALLRALPQPALPRSFTLPLEPAAAIPQRAAPAMRPVPVAAAAHRPGSLSGGRPPARRRPVQVLQWLSSIAAVLGIVFLLSGVFSTLHISGATTTSAPISKGAAGETQNTGAAKPPYPTHAPYAGSPTQTMTGPAPTSETPASTQAPTASANAGQNGSAGSSSNSPLGQIISPTGIGLALLLLSMCGFVTSWALRRRW